MKMPDVLVSNHHRPSNENRVLQSLMFRYFDSCPCVDDVSKEN